MTQKSSSDDRGTGGRMPTATFTLALSKVLGTRVSQLMCERKWKKIIPARWYSFCGKMSLILATGIIYKLDKVMKRDTWLEWAGYYSDVSLQQLSCTSAFSRACRRAVRASLARLLRFVQVQQGSGCASPATGQLLSLSLLPSPYCLSAMVTPQFFRAETHDWV